MVSMILESVNHEYNFNFSSFVLTFSIEINFLVRVRSRFDVNEEKSYQCWYWGHDFEFSFRLVQSENDQVTYARTHTHLFGMLIV